MQLYVVAGTCGCAVLSSARWWRLVVCPRRAREGTFHSAWPDARARRERRAAGRASGLVSSWLVIPHEAHTLRAERRAVGLLPKLMSPPSAPTALPVGRHQWEARCALPANMSLPTSLPHILMVPKTGSRALNTLAFCPRYRELANLTRAKLLDNRVHMHSQLYIDCSLATLRDPCERLVSIFRHLKERYSPSRASSHWCRFRSTPACSTHWIHNASTVVKFVPLLRDNWAEIIGHSTKDEYSTKRHLIVAMPQYLWIGPLSRIICSQRLQQELPKLARTFGGCDPDSCDCVDVKAPAANQTSPSGCTSINPVTGRLQGFDYGGRRYDLEALRPEELAHTDESCAQTRALYARDERLWRRSCATPTGD